MKYWFMLLGVSLVVAMDGDQTLKAIIWNGQVGKYKDANMTYYAKMNSAAAIQRLVKRKIDNQKSFTHEFVVPTVECVKPIMAPLIARQPESQSRAEYYEWKKEYNYGSWSCLSETLAVE